jgi:hypothetical protein
MHPSRCVATAQYRGAQSRQRLLGADEHNHGRAGVQSQSGRNRSFTQPDRRSRGPGVVAERLPTSTPSSRWSAIRSDPRRRASRRESVTATPAFRHRRLVRSLLCSPPIAISPHRESRYWWAIPSGTSAPTPHAVPIDHIRCELRLNLEARAIAEFFRRRALAIIDRCLRMRQSPCRICCNELR